MAANHMLVGHTLYELCNLQNKEKSQLKWLENASADYPVFVNSYLFCVQKTEDSWIIWTGELA